MYALGYDLKPKLSSCVSHSLFRQSGAPFANQSQPKLEVKIVHCVGNVNDHVRTSPSLTVTSISYYLTAILNRVRMSSPGSMTSYSNYPTI